MTCSCLLLRSNLCQKVSLPLSIYAAYAYDAIMVFVQALKSHIEKNGANGMDVKEAALNGSLLYSNIMEIQNFSSNFIQQS